MSKVSFAGALVLALTMGAARSQAPRPITQGDLLKTLDQINVDPANAKRAGAIEEPSRPKKEKTEAQTEITADAADFNNKTHIAIFSGKVIVKNPEFNVVCDKLTVYLRHDDKPAAGGKPTVAAPDPNNPNPPKPKGGGLEKAIAEMADGSKVIITQEKKEADGSITRSIGKAEKAIYNAVTGEIELSGWPDVKQGINSSVAVDDDTKMIMTRDGKMRTIGRARFLIQDSGNDKSPAPKSATP